MRYLPSLLFLFFLSPLVHAAQVGDSLDIATRLEQAGADQLALARVEHDQPDPGDGQHWARWEQLRLTLLSRLKRYGVLLARVEGLPTDAPAALRQAAYGLAADAALKLKQGAVARGYLARLLWSFKLDDKAYRRAREKVLQSYLVQSRAVDAYHVLLRLQQDYPVPDQVLVERTIKVLVANGMAVQAATWLPRLDDADPLKLLLRLESGLVTPSAALAAARSALQYGGAPMNWEVVLQVGSTRREPGLQVEALEHLLNTLPGDADTLSGVSGETLWRAYLAYAQVLGNRFQLLVGDDASWYGLALRQLQDAPSSGRALLAYLSVHAASAPLRGQSQAKLVASLQERGLGLAALRLFKEGAPANDGLSAGARYLLGDIAFQRQDFRYAARLWAGLEGPRTDMPRQQWQFERAYAFVKGGTPAAAERALDALFAGGQQVPQAMTQQMLALAVQLQDRGRDAKAAQLLRRLLTSANMSQRPRVLMALGRSAEDLGQYAVAADYYLQAATLKGGEGPQPLVQRAYLAAVENLRRAGLEQDAHGVLQGMRMIRQLSGTAAAAGAAAAE